jgi:hypothetical protein
LFSDCPQGASRSALEVFGACVVFAVAAHDPI